MAGPRRDDLLHEVLDTPPQGLFAAQRKDDRLAHPVEEIDAVLASRADAERGAGDGPVAAAGGPGAASEHGRRTARRRDRHAVAREANGGAAIEPEHEDAAGHAKYGRR